MVRDPRDPRNIPRPVTYPDRNPGFLTTRGSGRLAPVHMHTAYPDADGNGVTSISVSHYHRIRNWQILPDASDSHDHAIVRSVPNGRGI